MLTIAAAILLAATNPIDSSDPVFSELDASEMELVLDESMELELQEEEETALDDSLLIDADSDLLELEG